MTGFRFSRVVDIFNLRAMCLFMDRCLSYMIFSHGNIGEIIDGLSLYVIACTLITGSKYTLSVYIKSEVIDIFIYGKCF